MGIAAQFVAIGPDGTTGFSNAVINLEELTQCCAV